MTKNKIPSEYMLEEGVVCYVGFFSVVIGVLDQLVSVTSKLDCPDFVLRIFSSVILYPCHLDLISLSFKINLCR